MDYEPTTKVDDGVILVTTETTQKRRRGRPKIGEGGRTGEFVGFRCPANLKAQIERAADVNGRSISAECSFRITQSFIASETLTEATWMAQRITSVFERELAQMITRLRPLGWVDLVCGHNTETECRDAWGSAAAEHFGKPESTHPVPHT
jgi:hypothetical protein